MWNTITNNPVPSAFVGLGLYWLLKDSSGEPQSTRTSYQDTSSRLSNHEDANSSMEEQVKDTLHTAKEAVQGHLSEWKDQASQHAHEWQEETGQKLQEVKGYLQEKRMVARGEFNQLINENPLALGAVMIALGAAVAAAIPGSRKEDQWMGDSRDRVMKAVKTTVQSTVEDVKQKTGQVADKVLTENGENVH